LLRAKEGGTRRTREENKKKLLSQVINGLQKRKKCFEIETQTNCL